MVTWSPRSRRRRTAWPVRRWALSLLKVVGPGVGVGGEQDLVADGEDGLGVTAAARDLPVAFGQVGAFAL